MLTVIYKLSRTRFKSFESNFHITETRAEMNGCLDTNVMYGNGNELQHKTQKQ